MNGLSSLLYPVLYFDGMGKISKFQSKHELNAVVLSSSDPKNTFLGGTVLDSSGTMVRFNEVDRPAFRWLSALRSEVSLVDAKVDTVGMADAKRLVLSAMTQQFGDEPSFSIPGTPRYQLLKNIAQAGSIASVVQTVPVAEL